MSASIGYSLHARKLDDFNELAAYATELTRKASLEQLGYDITNPDENPEKEFQSFCIGDSGNSICWDDFTGCVKHLDIKAIIDQIVHHFPEMEFIYRVGGDGPLAYEAYINGDICERLLNKALYVGIENPEALRNVLKRDAGCKTVRSIPDFPIYAVPCFQIQRSRIGHSSEGGVGYSRYGTVLRHMGRRCRWRSI